MVIAWITCVLGLIVLAAIVGTIAHLLLGWVGTGVAMVVMGWITVEAQKPFVRWRERAR